ncbi:MAG: iron-containing redox enzyme family protein [Solirubrobacterales bacterium]|nr:iron-containing redox enzyme family protein [Solirubrobacterales bacterium]
MKAMPAARGPISEWLFESFARGPGAAVGSPPELAAVGDPLADDDLQLALYCCYELHYGGLPGIDDRLEWDPGVLAARAALETVFEHALLGAVGPPGDAPDARDMDLALRAIAEADEGPSLSRFLQRRATAEQAVEFLVHRSAYQLKEADPHSWALPRLHGAPKAALVEIQADEYGGGRAERIHATLFARSMDAFGLDSTPNAYLDVIPGATLATVNLMSLLGLHRRWRGAIVGHLALFEMTSSIPNRRYGDGLRRLGYDGAATDFFDEHVEADAVHENIAAVDLAGGLARQQPQLAADVIWGARALAELDGRWAAAVMSAWERDESSLLPPRAAAAPVAA